MENGEGDPFGLADSISFANCLDGRKKTLRFNQLGMSEVAGLLGDTKGITRRRDEAFGRRVVISTYCGSVRGPRRNPFRLRRATRVGRSR